VVIDPHDQNCSEARHESKETRPQIQQLGEHIDRGNVIGRGNLISRMSKVIAIAMTPSLKDTTRPVFF
jgi:hypothetical protein